MIFKFTLLSFLFFISASLFAEIKTKDKGEITFETQFFDDDGDETTNDQNYSLKVAYEFKAKIDSFQTKVSGFLRQDLRDENRNINYPTDLWLGYEKAAFIFKFGYQIINWSATEAFHPVDNVNSRNFDSEAQNAEKIGELMSTLKYQYGRGSITLMHMPLFTAPNFAPSSSRLGFAGDQAGLPEAEWVQDGRFQDSREANQYGAFLSHTFDNSDLVLSFLRIIDRNRPGFTALTATTVTPIFYEIKQYGITYQHVFGSYLFKLEAAYFDLINTELKESNLLLVTPKDHTEIAPGIEWSTSFAGGSETTFIIEYQRYFDTDETYDDFYLFQNDILIGARYAFNDDIGQEILFNTIFDLAGRNERFYNLDYSRRIGNFWLWKLGLRIIDASLKESGATAVGLEQLRNSDRIFSNLTRYF